MIKVTLSNEILKYITEIDKNRYKASEVSLPIAVASKLRKNSKKKSSYASTKIEGNPLSEKQVDEVIDSDERKHYLIPRAALRSAHFHLQMDELLQADNALQLQL